MHDVNTIKIVWLKQSLNDKVVNKTSKSYTLDLGLRDLQKSRNSSLGSLPINKLLDFYQSHDP